jgi:hypothetical protein
MKVRRPSSLNKSRFTESGVALKDSSGVPTNKPVARGANDNLLIISLRFMFLFYLI